MGSIMGAWQLTYIGFAIPSGILLDRMGSRWALTLGAFVIGLSALVRGFAPDYVSMLLAVMLFGVGGPIISAGLPKVITAWFEGQSRGLAMGIYMTGPAVGGIVSLTLTHSVLLPWLGGWRELMMVIAVITFLGGLFWFAIASNPLLASHESRGRAAGGLPQGKVLRMLVTQPPVLIVLLMSMGVFFFNHGLNNWLPELLRQGGMTLIEAGYWAAIPTVVGIAASLMIPRLATPGRRFIILAVLAGIAAGASLLLQVQAEPILLTGLLLQGIARSTMMTVLILTLVELPGIGDRYAGVASGMFFTAGEVGGVLGPLTLGIMYDASGGFATGLGTLTAIALLLAVAAVYLGSLVARRPA